MVEPTVRPMVQFQDWPTHMRRTVLLAIRRFLRAAGAAGKLPKVMASGVGPEEAEERFIDAINAGVVLVYVTGSDFRVDAECAFQVWDPGKGLYGEIILA